MYATSPLLKSRKQYIIYLMSLGSLQCINKMYSIQKSLEEFNNSVQRVIKNTQSIKEFSIEESKAK